MITAVENFHVVLPELVLLATAVLTLLADLYLGRLISWLPLTIASLGLASAAGLQAMSYGNYPVLAFSGMYMHDDMSVVMNSIIYLVVAFGFLYSDNYLRRHHIRTGDFYVLGLFATIGMSVLVASNSLLSIYLGLELLSLPLYAMTAMNRNSGNASEAAVKYFVMGAIASGFLLYGMSLLYGVTGKLLLNDIANSITVLWQDNHSIILFSMVFILAGVSFKLTLAPFHMWAPDVYDGAATPVTMLISAAPKIAAVGMLLRLFTTGFADAHLEWGQVLYVFAMLSIGIGNMLAIVQTQIRRLLAYSGISHMGYAALAIAMGSNEGFVAGMYYALVYGLMALAAFGLLSIAASKDRSLNRIEELGGFAKDNPWLAFLFMLTLFSMAGVPPMVGFVSKLMVLKAVVNAGFVGSAVIALLFAVVGAYFYIRLIKIMYFDKPVHKEFVVEGNALGISLLSVNTLALLLLGIFPLALIECCVRAFS